MAYKFSKTARPEKPQTATVELLEKAERGESLTRQEKDDIAETLYGIFSCHGATYRLYGWAWNMRPYMRRILVNFKYDNHFLPYYAPDKTSLRKALKWSRIVEMIYA